MFWVIRNHRWHWFYRNGGARAYCDWKEARDYAFLEGSLDSSNISQRSSVDFGMDDARTLSRIYAVSLSRIDRKRNYISMSSNDQLSHNEDATVGICILA